MAVPVYSVHGGVHTIDFPGGARLELRAPQYDRAGRLMAEVVTYADPTTILNTSTLSLLDDGACQRYAQRCRALDGQVDWAARLAFVVYHVRERLAQDEQARNLSRSAAHRRQQNPIPWTRLTRSLCPWRSSCAR